MAIEFLSYAIGSSASVTVPAVLAGDLILVISYRSNSGTITTPFSGFSSAVSASGGSNSVNVMWKVAPTDAGSENVGTNIPGQRLRAVVYRGCDPDSPIGQTSAFAASNTTPVYGEVASNTPAHGLIFGFAETQSSVPASVGTTPPTGMSARYSTAGLMLSDGAIETHAEESLAAGTSGRWATALVGLVPASGAPARRRSPLLLSPW